MLAITGLNAHNVSKQHLSLVKPSRATIRAVPVLNVTHGLAIGRLNSLYVNDGVSCIGISLLVAVYTNLIAGIEVFVIRCTSCTTGVTICVAIIVVYVVCTNLNGLLLTFRCRSVIEHRIDIAGSEFLNIGSLVGCARSVVLCTVNDKCGNAYRKLDRINIISFSALADRLANRYAGPSCIFSTVFAVPVINVNVAPLPIVLEVYSYSIFKIKCATNGAKTVCEGMISRLAAFHN